MATLTSVHYRRPGTRHNMPPTQVTSIEVIFRLTADEAQRMPAQRMLRQIFGPEGRTYHSIVRQDWGELIIVYYLSDRPFGLTDPDQIVESATTKVNKILRQPTLSGTQKIQQVKKQTLPKLRYPQGKMVRVYDVKLRRRAAYGRPLEQWPVTSIEVCLVLTPEAAALLPRQSTMKSVFGREAETYDSRVKPEKGAVVLALYRLAAKPFGSTDPQKVTDKCWGRFETVLAQRKGQFR